MLIPTATCSGRNTHHSTASRQGEEKATVSPTVYSEQNILFSYRISHFTYDLFEGYLVTALNDTVTAYIQNTFKDT
jgi:hypothetical protein